MPDGASRIAKVEVGFTHLGNLTTEDQKTYYGLIRQWEAMGRPREHTFFSTRKLARTLKKKWGSNVIEATTESLRRLRTTPFAWLNSYLDSGTGEALEVLDTFTILADLKIIRRKIDGHITKEAGYFCVHDLILKNLLANHTKPLLFDVILGFKSEIAQLLYTHVDLMLSRNDHYERRSRELFNDLGLNGSAYRNPSNRKQRLELAIQELNGVPLSTGVIGRAAVERTKDKKDYKAVFSKVKRLHTTDVGLALEKTRVGDSREKPPSGEDPLRKQAVELVSRFYKTFHHVDKPLTRPKEIVQAVSLIATYGFERAEYVVDFSHSAAGRTNYHPQTFGGILQYAARVSMDFEFRERQREMSRKELVAQEAREQDVIAERKRIDQRLSSLSEEDYQRLYETVKSEYSAKFPSAMAIKGSLFEFAIRARMARLVSDAESQSA